MWGGVKVKGRPEVSYFSLMLVNMKSTSKAFINLS